MAERGSLPFPIRLLDSALHMHPCELDSRLQTLVEEEQRTGSRILLVCGDCAPTIAELSRQDRVVRVAGANCGEMVLGKPEHKRLMKEGAFLLFPEWAERWKDILLRFPGMDAELARAMLRQMHTRFVYVDTGVCPVPHDALRACSEFFGLPYEMTEVGIDHFEAAVREAVERAGIAETRRSGASHDRSATAVMMLDIITAVLKHPGDIPQMASQLSQRLRELTGSRMVILVTVREPHDRRPGHRVLVVNPSRHASLLKTEPVARIIEESLRMDQAAVLPLETGGPPGTGAVDSTLSPCLVIPLKSGEERIGAVISLGLLDASFAGSILAIEDILSSVLSVVVGNALLQERQQQILQDLEREIGERKQAEATIRHMATHDALTGLPSLGLAKDRLTMALGAARRNRNMAALMFVDLDGFKAVNDKLGHDAGDQVLKHVGGLLRSCVRETDTVARIGGDEFLIVATALRSADNAASIAEKIVRIVSTPLVVEGESVNIGASVGVALFPRDSEEPERLIKLADEAMYEVKYAGKNGYRFAASALG